MDIWKTPQQRAHAVEAVRDSRRAERARHAEAAWDNGWVRPRNTDVQRLVNDSLEAMWAATDANEEAAEEDPCQAIGIEDLTRDEILDMRAEAAKNPELIRFALDLMGEDDARRLYTNSCVDDVLSSNRFTSNIRLHVRQGN